MRRKPGFKELPLYLADEVYARLEQYWRFHTGDKHITASATRLLSNAIETALQEAEKSGQD
jgi:hypothetical protein